MFIRIKDGKEDLTRKVDSIIGITPAESNGRMTRLEVDNRFIYIEIPYEDFLKKLQTFGDTKIKTIEK